MKISRRGFLRGIASAVAASIPGTGAHANAVAAKVGLEPVDLVVPFGRPVTPYVWVPYIPLQVTPTFFDPEEFTSSRGIKQRYSRELVRDDFYEKVGPGEYRTRVALVDARGRVAGHAEGVVGVQSIAQRKPAEVE